SSARWVRCLNSNTAECPRRGSTSRRNGSWRRSKPSARNGAFSFRTRVSATTHQGRKHFEFSRKRSSKRESHSMTLWGCSLITRRGSLTFLLTKVSRTRCTKAKVVGGRAALPSERGPPNMQAHCWQDFSDMLIVGRRRPLSSVFRQRCLEEV